MTHGLFALLFDALPVAPSQTLPDGTPSRGWTLRPDRLNANATRFDWIHGTSPAHGTSHRGGAGERTALRDDVLAAAARVARAHGFTVKADGIGLLIAATPDRSRRPVR